MKSRYVQRMLQGRFWGLWRRRPDKQIRKLMAIWLCWGSRRITNKKWPLRIMVGEHQNEEEKDTMDHNRLREILMGEHWEEKPDLSLGQNLHSNLSMDEHQKTAKM
jgi:hypothetical protein